MSIFNNFIKVLIVFHLIILIFICSLSLSAQTISKRYNIINQIPTFFVSGNSHPSLGVVMRDMLFDILEDAFGSEDKYIVGGTLTEYSDGKAIAVSGFSNWDNNTATFNFDIDLGGYHPVCFVSEPPPDFYKYTDMNHF